MAMGSDGCCAQDIRGKYAASADEALTSTSGPCTAPSLQCLAVWQCSASSFSTGPAKAQLAPSFARMCVLPVHVILLVTHLVFVDRIAQAGCTGRAGPARGEPRRPAERGADVALLEHGTLCLVMCCWRFFTRLTLARCIFLPGPARVRARDTLTESSSSVPPTSAGGAGRGPDCPGTAPQTEALMEGTRTEATSSGGPAKV